MIKARPLTTNPGPGRFQSGLMPARQSAMPRCWILTDEKRLPDPDCLPHRLPRGTGLIFRHYRHPDRTHVATRFAAICRDRGLVFSVAGDPALARRLNADGVHLPEWLLDRPRLWRPMVARRMILTAAVHSPRAAREAASAGADAILISPVFPTASHPGARTLGPMGFTRIAGDFPGPAFALGGMTEDRLGRLPLAAGWAAIGAWTSGPASRN